jgi:hypothetical protein
MQNIFGAIYEVFILQIRIGKNKNIKNHQDARAWK